MKECKALHLPKWCGSGSGRGGGIEVVSTSNEPIELLPLVSMTQLNKTGPGMTKDYEEKECFINDQMIRKVWTVN